METILLETTAKGFVLVFTDGSSEKFKGVGRLGGYGVYSDQGVALSSHMPLEMKQTNNAAELMAALRALQMHPVVKIAQTPSMSCSVSKERQNDGKSRDGLAHVDPSATSLSER